MKSYSRIMRSVTNNVSVSLSHLAFPLLWSTGWGRCSPSLLKATIYDYHMVWGTSHRSFSWQSELTISQNDSLRTFLLHPKQRRPFSCPEEKFLPEKRIFVIVQKRNEVNTRNIIQSCLRSSKWQEFGFPFLNTCLPKLQLACTRCHT